MIHIKRNSQRLITIALLVLLSACSTSRYGKDSIEDRERLKVADRLIKEHCKTAGVKIYRTAKDVEGIFLMKIRPNDINYGDQFKMDDPYGKDLGGEEGYIGMFLKGRTKSPEDAKSIRPELFGYRYVEAIDPKDGKRYRYTGGMRDVEVTSSIIGGGDGRHKFIIKKFVLDKVLGVENKPRYGVTYDDISTRKDREHWIAGSSLRVIDLQNNEVMAERIGYMMDYGQGSNAGGRSPWLMAANNACPVFWPRHGSLAQLRQTQYFVEQVLIPKEGE